MNCDLQYGYQEDWKDSVVALFNKTDMKRSSIDQVNRGFNNSQVVASLWQGDSIVAIGRMLTDFEMYSSIYDVVVDPKFQRFGLGKKIMDALVGKAPGTCVHLTSTFGNEPFYIKQGFRFHKSAMALYPKSFGKTPYLDWKRGVDAEL